MKNHWGISLKKDYLGRLHLEDLGVRNLEVRNLRVSDSADTIIIVTNSEDEKCGDVLN